MALLERDTLLESLRRAAADAASGRGRLVLLGGDAGVGKTTLARHFAAEQGSLGVEVVWGACDALYTPRPLAPFAGLTTADGPHDVATVVLESGAPRKLVVLEDVHWADEATLDVIRLLARRIGTTSTLAIATYRDLLDRVHPLRIVLGELATNDAVSRLDVPALSREAVAALVAGSGLDAHEVYRRSGGNSFFVAEVLAAGGERVPATVRDAVLARAARLEPASRAVLDAVATSPEGTEPWLLDAIVPEDAAAAADCLSAGILIFDEGRFRFRHELARLAIDESLDPGRRIDLHRRVLRALQGAPSVTDDAARLAHHAEASDDGDAVLAHGVAAAVRATKVGAHREAAAQYARVLRFAGELAPREQAALLERRSQALYLTDDQVEAIAALEQAIACRRLAGDVLGESFALSQLVPYLTCRGRLPEAEAAAEAAVALLQSFPPGPELAAATHALAHHRLVVDDLTGALDMGGRALELANRFAGTTQAVSVEISVATARFLRDGAEGLGPLEEALERAERAGLDEHAVRALHNIAAGASLHRLHELCGRHVAAGLERCEELDLDLWRLSLLSVQARSELQAGRWTAASAIASMLIDDPRDSPEPQFQGFLVRALVRARRGDPNVHEPLAAAAAVEGAPEELSRSAALASAHAEVAWLGGRSAGVREATEFAFRLARERESAWWIAELGYWRSRAGIDDALPDGVALPYRLQLGGDWAGAAAAWEALACPYELSLALAEADDDASLRRGLDEARRLGARPLANRIAKRLRDRGARSIPRGPRATTLANPAGLTERELQIVGLLAEGLRNGEIAERLFVSGRTVDHHVSAILRKLDATSRGEAVALARELGLPGGAFAAAAGEPAAPV